MIELSQNKDYQNWLKEIKQKIKSAQYRAALSVNSVLLELYWDIGKEVVEKQKNADWGSGFIEQFANDLRKSFPDIKGFSKRNVYAMRQWYLFYSEHFEFVPQLVAQIPWGHNRLIMSKIKDITEALFYVQATIENGWGRDNLEIQIGKNYYLKKGNAITNFEKTLPSPQSDLAKETIKDPYDFDFLGLEDDALEKEIETELTKHITEFLIELGKGFAYVGRQYHIKVSEKDYYIDLLFYHLDLRCYVVIELKAGIFKPEHAGKLNFYLSAVDTLVKRKEDNPTIGILLCKKKDRVEAEFALRDINKPIGISDYLLTKAIPEEIKTKLPTVEQLENELSEMEEKNKKE
jgi:predicted nuclease of restriction endonuclease-like (RecB) superfamily